MIKMILAITHLKDLTMSNKIWNIFTFKLLILLPFAVGCTTANTKCNKIHDTIDRKKCYKNKEAMKYHNHTGWRYEHGNQFR